MTHKDYLKLAVPFILSTVTTPLLGAVDMAVMGRMPDPAYIGGVSIGVVIFNTMYWLCGFLRVSTTGLSSQAMGSRDDEAVMWALLRPLAIALAVGVLIVGFQAPLFHAAVSLLGPQGDVRRYAEEFFFIVVWGAPFVLTNYVLLGWLMGQLKLRASLLLQITTNVINIALSILLALGLGWNVTGVATATLTAQIASVFLGVWLVRRHGRFDREKATLARMLEPAAMKRILMINGDLVIRTVCLLAVTNLFVSQGNAYGKDVLAGNAILLQIQYLMAYVFDGLANASSVISGKAVGKNDPALYNRGVSLAWQWCLYCSIILSTVYAAGYEQIFRLFTVIPEVLALCDDFAPWMIAFPFCASVGLVFYGVFSGATQTRPIRNSMLLALLLYIPAQYALTSAYGNHGLLAAFLLFSLGRSVFLGMYVRCRR